MERTLKKAVRVVALVAVALLASCNWDETTPENPFAAQYRAAVQGVLDRYQAPGAAVAVLVPGREPWKMPFGLSDVESKRPMTTREHFSIRSITKSVTVTVILQLARDGALSLDDPIEKYVPGIPNGTRISLAQLAAMESGIENYSDTDAFQNAIRSNISRTFTQSELVGFAIPESPVFDPGVRYQYSNTNTVLLGMVIEAVTRTSLAEVFRARIFEPLRLSQTTYPTETPLPDPHPTPYTVDPQANEIEALPLLSPTGLAAAGAMVSTLDDLATWGTALGSGSLLTPQLQALRFSHSRPATDGPTYERYGLGIGMIKGWWGHTGTGFGWQAATFYDPQSGATIAVLVNATPETHFTREDNIAEDIFSALADVVAAH